jgi:hypothetical protein
MPRHARPMDEEIGRLARANAGLGHALAARTRELKAVREQQTATAEILGTINRAPTDLRPVLETIVTHAARLCEAHFAFVMLNEGGRLALAARTACTPEFAEFLKGGKPPSRASTTGLEPMTP